MKLSIVIPVHNAQEITAECLQKLDDNSTTHPQVVIIDNGSEVVTTYAGYDNLDIKQVRNDKNTGVWPTFKQGFDESDGDVIAYIHNDLMIHEKGWDQRVLDSFDADRSLGLVGVVGSDEWGANGGRGGGTMSNFLGLGRGSAAEVHGRRVTDLRAALQVDGCAMIMNRTAMLAIGFFEWPPHHFYDRIYSLRMIKHGLHVAVLGIGCDHVSGQTANTQQGWQDTAEEWCKARGIMEMTAHNWDYTVYNVAEGMFLNELHEYLAGRQLIACDSQHNII